MCTTKELLNLSTHGTFANRDGKGLFHNHSHPTLKPSKTPLSGIKTPALSSRNTPAALSDERAPIEIFSILTAQRLSTMDCPIDSKYILAFLTIRKGV